MNNELLEEVKLSWPSFGANRKTVCPLKLASMLIRVWMGMTVWNHAGVQRAFRR